MNAILRNWLGCLSLAAGLLHLALVIGSPLPVVLVLLLLSSAELLWGVFALVRPTPPLPQLARSAALVPVLGWILLLIVGGADSFGPLTTPESLFPMVVASVFDVAIAGILTGMLRATTPATSRPHNLARYLVGTVGGALLIAALATPALAATQAGQSALPHDNGSDVHVSEPGHKLSR